MSVIAVINEFSVEAVRDALQKLDDFESLTVNGLTAFEINEIENIDPQLFSELSDKIRSKRWIPFPGMWTEEIEKISEEKLTRNAMYSSLYFKEKFGMKYRVFYGAKVYNNFFAQIIYNCGFDAALLTEESGKLWVTSADDSRTLAVGLGEFICADINDIDDDFIKANQFTSFEEAVTSLFSEPLELENIELPPVRSKTDMTEEILLKAEKISRAYGESKIEEIRNAWISLLVGNEKAAADIAKKIIAERTLSEDYITVNSKDVVLLSLKAAEDKSGDTVIRIAEMSGEEKSLTIICKAINAGFYCEIMPYEMQTFRVDKDGFVKETLITE